MTVPLKAPKRANPYCRPLREAFRDWVLLNGVLFQFHSHHEHRALEIQKVLRDHPESRNWFGAGAALLIEDLTFWPSDRWARPFPIGGHVRFGVRFLRELKRIAAREAAWSVAEAFEVFERYVLNLAAVHLRRNPKRAQAAPWVAKRRKQARPLPRLRRTAEFQSYVRSAYRGSDDVLARFRRSIPAFRLGEQKDMNVQGFDFGEWWGTVSAVRHAVVHNRGVVSATQLRRLGPIRTKLLARHFPGTLFSYGYRLQLDQKSAELAIQHHAEYAFHLYKEVSRHDGFDPEVFRSRRIQT